jgi:ABC-type polar amino acid transport system ATPase subunit
MDEGRIIEEGTPAEFFDAPKQERTRAFLAKIL